MNLQLNARAWSLAEQMITQADELRLVVHHIGGARVLDAGIQAEGGLAAGLSLARLCLADLGDVQIVPGMIGDVGWPAVQVTTDHPLEACLYSQYAGWQIAVGKYFAMGSGPMRAVAAREELFQKTGFKEQAECAVGILEGRKLPTVDVVNYLVERTGIPAERLLLAIAPTASQAGNLQVVARMVETALHKLHELGFDVSRVRSACGTVPLPPVAKDDLTGIGRTNDAILYGGRVWLTVQGDDDAPERESGAVVVGSQETSPAADLSLRTIGPRVPANGSPAYGQPFLEIFEAAGRDFYKIDPHLFSPAEVVFQNLRTGRVHRFGQINADVLRRSFGI